MSITVLNKKAIAVKLPDDAHSFEIYENNVIGGFCVMYLRGEPDYACQYSPNLPPGQWLILGMSDVLTEEQWEKVVDIIEGDPAFYCNYDATNFREVYAASSGQTLLKSKGITTPHLILINQQSFK